MRSSVHATQRLELSGTHSPARGPTRGRSDLRVEQFRRFAGLAERVKTVEVTFDQSLFLGARPTLELRFPGSCFREGRKRFNAQDRNRGIQLSGPTCLAG